MKLQVIALVKYDRRGASTRVRFWNLVPLLEAKGWEVKVCPLLTDEVLSSFYSEGRHRYSVLLWHLIRRIGTLLTIGSPAIVWVEKELLHGMPGIVEASLFGRKISRTVFDYDDAVFVNYNDQRLGSLGRARKFAWYARRAGYISVGSESLRQQMCAWGGERISYIPSTVIVKNYPVHVHGPRARLVIGWIGTPKTVHFLDCLKGVLPVVAAKCRIQFRVVGARWECAGVDVVNIPWSEDSEGSVVSEFDVGVMPLIDGPWERAKCGYKLIQYMAAGVVPLGARVGENKAIIQDGVNGFLASEPEEWITKLLMVCNDFHMRAEMGLRARSTALAKYDVSIAAGAVDGVFRKIASPPTGSLS